MSGTSPVVDHAGGPPPGAAEPEPGPRQSVPALLAAAFWNGDERRLRALWRVAGLVCLVLLLGGLLRASGIFPEQGTLEFYLAATPARLWTGLVAVLLAGLVLDRRPFRDFGFALDRRWLADLGFGLALGALLMCGVFLVEWSLGWLEVSGSWRTPVDGMSFGRALLTPVVVFVSVGILEELVFRGYLLRNLAEGLAFRRLGGPRGGLIVATVLSSALFALGHANNPNATWVSTVNVGLAGLLLALGFLLTGQLAIPIGLHVTWNLFQASAFGFPVSGTTVVRTAVLATEETGPDLWTGGAFGPEAGLVGLGAMLLGVGLTVAWVRWRRGEARIVTGLTEPPRPS